MTPKCPKCDNTSFELNEMKVNKSDYKLYGVCSSKCGTVVGTHEFYNIGQLLHNFAKKMNIRLE